MSGHIRIEGTQSVLIVDGRQSRLVLHAVREGGAGRDQSYPLHARRVPLPAFADLRRACCCVSWPVVLLQSLSRGHTSSKRPRPASCDPNLTGQYMSPRSDSALGEQISGAPN